MGALPTDTGDSWTDAAVEQNRQWMTAYALSMIGDPTAADDAVQEAFTIAYQKRGEFERGTNFGGWLRTILRHVALRHIERAGRRPVITHEQAVARLEAASAALTARSLDPSWAEDRAGFLRECLRKLTDIARKLVRMRYADGMSSTQMASACGRSVSSVNVSVFRARAALADCIRDKEAPPGRGRA